MAALVAAIHVDLRDTPEDVIRLWDERSMKEK
jgi:hypothetical protein